MEHECIVNDMMLAKKLQSDSELKNLHYQEQLILEVTEIIAKLMHRHKVTKSALAGKLGRSRSYVTQLLGGTCNMTLRTISDVFVALDSMLIPNAGPLSLERGQAYDDSYYKFEDEHQIMQRGIVRKQLPSGPFWNMEYKILAA